MAVILAFTKKRSSMKGKGHALCKSGFHLWVIVQDKPFDTKQGKLITLQRCSRCGLTKSQAL
jgi:hypothetical protein